MIVIPWDDLAWEPEPGKVKGAYRETIDVRIDNEDGSKMHAVETVTIDIEEGAMTKRFSQPLTLGWAIGLSVSVIVATLACAGTTYGLIHSDVKDVRTSVDSVRDSASDDVKTLRADMRDDYSRIDAKFDKVGDKLDKITEIVTETKLQQSKKSQE